MSSFEILLPNLYPPDLARFDGNGICVYGNASDNAGQPAIWVGAKLYQPGTPVPPNPPSDATPATITGNTWTIANLPCAASTAYLLAAWAQWMYVSPAMQASVSILTSDPGPYTDCNYPQFTPNLRGSGSSATFDVMPVAWQVQTQGFSGSDVTPFNGSSTLRLVKSPNQKVLYCNGGNAGTVPRIQLSCENPQASEWILSFELAGKRVNYSHPSTLFDGQSRNAFCSAQTVGLGEHVGIPAMVSVQPV